MNNPLERKKQAGKPIQQYLSNPDDNPPPKIPFTLYHSNVTDDTGNCYYKHKKTINGIEALKEAITFDHTLYHYKNDYRSKDNFIDTQCLFIDIDNDDPK